MLPVLVFFGTLAAAWYWLIARPQREVQGRHERLVSQLAAGDHVMTVGGLYGRVHAIDGGTVVLELAPGVVTRVSVQGLARIVANGDAPLPTNDLSMHDAAGSPHQAPAPMEQQSMNHHHQQHHHQPQQPQYAGPHLQQPAPPAPGPWQHPAAHAAAAPGWHSPASAEPPGHTSQVVRFDPAQHVPQHVHVAAAPQQVPYAQLPGQPVTLRAADPMSTSGFAPRPWQAPITSSAAPHGHQPSMSQPQPFQFSLGSLLPQSAPAAGYHRSVPAAQYQQPYAQLHEQHQPGAYVGGAAAHAMHHQPSPMTYGPPPAAGHQHAGVPSPAHHAQAESQGRARSRAPQGMGSSVRIDDPAVQQAFERAREERMELAREYQRMSSPLVDTGETPPVAQAQQHGALLPPPPPGSQQLFVAQGSPAVQPQAVFPAAARPPDAGGVPRPLVGPPQVDEQTSAAFQRRAPYAPEGGQQALVAG